MIFKLTGRDYSNFENSDSSNILTIDCSFKPLSFDRMDAFNFSARAKKSESFRLSGISDCASFNDSEYFDSGTNSITFCNLSKNSLNFSFDNFVFLRISDLLFFNSSNANFGENRSWSTNKSFLIKEPFQKNENKTLVSSTSFIYSRPFDFRYSNLFSLTKFPNSNASFSVNSLLPRFSSINSINSTLSKSFLAAFLNTSVQLISGCDSISAFSFSGNDIVNSVIDNRDSDNYLSFSSGYGGKI
jgi:hypothetical protein